MSSDASSGGDIAAQHVRDFFLARQPILNREQHLAAYELLFRDAAVGAVNVVDHMAATATVIAHVADLGLENVVGDALAFVNIDAEVLMSDVIGFMPRGKVVLEILETVEVTPAIIERVKELVGVGYHFALDDVIAQTDDVRQLLPFVEYIKVDILQIEPTALAGLVSQLKQGGQKLLAEKVETQAEFETCLNLGFDYFQGYYFAKPLLISGKKLAPSQLAIIRLISQIVSDQDSDVLEKTIKNDVSLSLNLLRLVNSVGVGGGRHVETLNQALVVLGRVQLQRWLQILLYAGEGQTGGLKSPLLSLAITRGKLLELMTQKCHPGNRALSEKSFTVGIMSLMDVLFGLPMTEVLAQLAVAPEVQDALLLRRGELGDMLKLAEYIECIEQAWPLMPPLVRKLGLSSDDLKDLQAQAFHWSCRIAGAAI